eukprot:SAG31_NODE_1975_length_6751_cov_2.067498_6_plen_540_part_00
MLDLCLEPVAEEPTAMKSCFHTFCRACLLPALRRDRKRRCPTCRQPAGAAGAVEAQVTKAHMAAALIDELVVLCPNGVEQEAGGQWVAKAGGCSAAVPRGQLAAHLACCAHRPVGCGHAGRGCGWRGLATELAAHTRGCWYEQGKAQLDRLERQAAELRAEMTALRAQQQQGPAPPAPAGPAGLVPRRLLRTLEGDESAVNCVVPLLGGARLASGSDDDSNIRIWDVATGALVRTLQGHDDVVGAAVALTGNRLASGSEDHTVKIWDHATGTLLHTLEGHTRSVECLASLPEEQLASGSADCTIKIWDLTSGALVRTLQAHTDWVQSLAVLPDSQQLASGSDDHTIKIWDTATWGQVKTLDAGRRSSVWSLASLLDNRLAASDDRNHTGEVRIWHVPTGALQTTLAGGLRHHVVVGGAARQPAGEGPRHWNDHDLGSGHGDVAENAGGAHGQCVRAGKPAGRAAGEWLRRRNGQDLGRGVMMKGGVSGSSIFCTPVLKYDVSVTSNADFQIAKFSSYGNVRSDAVYTGYYIKYGINLGT